MPTGGTAPVPSETLKLRYRPPDPVRTYCFEIPCEVPCRASVPALKFVRDEPETISSTLSRSRSYSPCAGIFSIHAGTRHDRDMASILDAGADWLGMESSRGGVRLLRSDDDVRLGRDHHRPCP